ncbi:MAG: DUF6480 family protein [Actinomycetota bacterium]|nr:DUF6480 family protein [Actinomycetota bacterium]
MADAHAADDEADQAQRRGASSDSPGADPAFTPGLEPGAGVAPGDTPPSADQMSGAGGDDRRGPTPNMGPVSGNRTPMIFTLVILALVVLAVAIFSGLSLIAPP